MVCLLTPVVYGGEDTPGNTPGEFPMLDQVRRLIERNEMDSARQKLRSLMQDMGEPESEKLVVAYKLLSEAYEEQSLLDSAVYYMEQAWSLAKKINPSRYAGQYPQTLAYYYWEKGNYSQALKNAQTTKRYLNRENKSKNLMRLDNVLGLIYRDLGNYERAETHFKKAISLANQLKEEHYKGIIMANLGSLYQKQGDYNRAISYYERGSNLELKYEDYTAAGRSFVVIGELYTGLADYSQALSSLKKARLYNSRANDLVGLCRTKNAMGKLFSQTGAYQKARKFFLEAEKMADNQGARKQLMKSYEGLYQNYHQTGNPKKAFHYQSKYLNIYKDLYRIPEIVQLENLQHKLNLQREKNKNQQEQIEKQNTINRLLLALALLSAALTAVFILLFIRIRLSKKSLQQKNKEIHGQKEKLEKLNRHLNIAREEAEQSEQLKDQFLRNISHEIRTPLNGILGFSSIIAEGEINKDQRKEYHTFIKRNANLLLSTIDDILDIARIRTKQVEVFKEHFRVFKMLEELKKTFSFDQAYSKGENVDVKIDESHAVSDFKLYSDATKIRKILVILIDNALKFTREGFVKIGMKPNGREVMFFVQDTGIGISHENQSMIYESFRQADSELNRQVDGMGAGLSIAKSFVEILEGKIWFESEPYRGTTFYFTIPHEKVA
ncbi:MAG: tetratricopeptide repeat protein [Bacteroidales bacterium]|nr:tetratricopeptide repeat protein [Bacteroidales bacterium]